jgi:geranylgeranyl reductase family protein
MRDGATSGTVINAEVGIIGAGPAGTATAVALGQLGVRGGVLADKHGFPRDKTCGSGVSPKGIKVLRTLGVWPELEREATWIRGMRLVTPGDRETFLSAGGALDAIVCKRRTLDHVLLKRAQRLGVTFVPDCAANSLIEHDGRVVGFRTRQGHEVRSRYTVVAGGTHCALTTKGRPTPNRLIQAIMGWWKGVPYRSGHIEMIFDKMIAPYYGWLFPESDDVVNIGITYEDLDHSHKARELFQRFLDKHYADRLAGAEQLGRWKGHPIAYDYSVGNLTAPGQLVVGEAGRMTHPATAEGIYQAMQSGIYAAQAIRDILSGRRSEFVAFRTYEWRCKMAFEASFLAARAFRKLVQTPALDWMVGVSDNPAVQSLTGRVLALM